MIHIAVTGTKGKSTTLRALQHAFLAKKKSVGGLLALTEDITTVKYTKKEMMLKTTCL